MAVLDAVQPEVLSSDDRREEDDYIILFSDDRREEENKCPKVELSPILPHFM